MTTIAQVARYVFCYCLKKSTRRVELKPPFSGREKDRLELLAAEKIPPEGEIEARQGSMQIRKNADCERVNSR